MSTSLRRRWSLGVCAALALGILGSCSSSNTSNTRSVRTDPSSGSSYLTATAGYAPPPSPVTVAPSRASMPDDSPSSEAVESRGSVAANAAPMQGGAGQAATQTTTSTRPLPRETHATSWQPAQATPNALRVSLGGNEVLPLRGVQLRTQVDGMRARVVIDAYVHNDRAQNYEGTFQLRLPEGASPYFFAFGETTYTIQDPRQVSIPFFSASAQQGALAPEDILRQRASSWNSPREARIVPRERAAQAYTETVRNRVDPVLLEWSGAGVFEARVFPLVAGRLHRIVIGYDVDLERRGDEAILPLRLPADVPQAVLDLAVATPQGLHASLEPSLPVREEGGYLRTRIEGTQQRSVTLHVRGPTPVLTGADGASGVFWSTSIVPSVPTERAATESPRRAMFLLDTSLSAQPENFGRWLRVVEQVLSQNTEQIHEFAVLFFDVGTRWWRPAFARNTVAEREAFFADARRTYLEGATDLANALRQAAHPSWFRGAANEGWDAFLLSDGAATWGEHDAHRIAAGYRGAHRGRLFAYRLNTSTTDNAMLTRLARDTGGSVFSVGNDSEIAAAATAYRNAPWQLSELSVEGATDVLIAGAPSTIYPGQVLQLAGRGQLSNNATATLRLSRGNSQTTLRVPLGPQVSSTLAPRAYGQLAVQRLEDVAPLTEAQARSYATHFRVTGRTCSLVMLESEADYQRFGIIPADDARVVRTQPVTNALLQIDRDQEQALGDPQQAFLSWMDRLPHTPGVQLSVPADLRSMLAQLPTSAFEMPAETLQTGTLQAAQLPESYRAQLSAEELDYDVVSTEAARRRQQNQQAEGVRALSSLVEKRPGDTVLARDVAFTATEWGLPVAAHGLLRRVQAARPYEMHTYRSLAESAVAMGRNDLALAYYELALRGQWGPRTQDFHTITGVGYLHFLREIARGTRRVAATDFARSRLQELAASVTPARADLLVMIAWSTDNTDVDLHVVDANNEECYYGHRQTRMGGFLTQDVTQGYGPEMFVQPQASPGNYRAFLHFYRSDRNRASARTRVLATVYRRWGSANEEVTTRALTLGDTGDRQDIEQIVWNQ